MDIQDFLKREYGYDREVKDCWTKRVDDWLSWYCGKVKSFHNYKVYNGTRNIRMQKLSLQSAKRCCEDWADLLFNEKCKISLADDVNTKKLNKILSQNDFWSLVNASIEMSGASGTGAFVVSVRNIIVNDTTGVYDVTEGKVKVQYVDCEGVYPISWDKRAVTECAFAATSSIKGRPVVNLSVHVKDERGNYVIHNHVFEGVPGNISHEIECSDVETDFNTGSATPWFAMLSPAGVNQIYPSSPWGLPYYANAIDSMKGIDNSYDSLNNEIVLGRKRIFAKQNLFNVSPDGTKLTFDENDVSIYVLPTDMNSSDMIQPENSELRVSDITTAINFNLSVFSQQVGFGAGYYRYDSASNSVKTAREVISRDSAMFRRKKKHETVLESCLYDTIAAICYASSTFGAENIKSDGLTVSFDDSIVEDKDTISSRALRELSASVISPVEYREIVMGEDREAAQRAINDIRSQYPTMGQLMGES